MNMEEAAVKIEGHEHEIKSLKHRMDAVSYTHLTLPTTPYV